MKGALLGAMFSRHVKRHPGHRDSGEVSSAADPPRLRPRPPGQRGTAARGGELVPLIGFISVGLGSAVLYLLRLALYSPDISWDRKNNPEPWNKLGPTDQYKFIAVSTDYKNLKKERPSF